MGELDLGRKRRRSAENDIGLARGTCVGRADQQIGDSVAVQIAGFAHLLPGVVGLRGSEQHEALAAIAAARRERCAFRERYHARESGHEDSGTEPLAR